MKDNYTHLALVVDRSGSMATMCDDAQGGINTLIKDQSEVPGDITVSLYQFDSVYEKVFGPVPAKDAPEYVLTPRGSTALLDATGRAIVETGEFLAGLSEDERPSKVIFAVVTDGHENASKEYDHVGIKKMVTEQQDKWNWEFIYIGANVDAFAESQKLGFRGSSQYQGTGASSGGSYKYFTRSVTNSRVTGQSVSSTLVDVDADGQEILKENKA